MKLASALYRGHYPFDEMGLFDEYNVVTFPRDLDRNSVLVVWGGGDISPSLYNKPVGKATYADAALSRRDFLEWQLMCEARDLGIPIIGICRGAQMLCAMAGGYLIQDITNHGSEHKTITDTGDVFTTSSLHHQMMMPFEVDHKLVAWSKHRLSKHYLDVDEPVNVDVEPEFVYFPKQKGVAIQWHPEYMSVDCDANNFVKKKIQEYCL